MRLLRGPVPCARQRSKEVIGGTSLSCPCSGRDHRHRQPGSFPNGAAALDAGDHPQQTLTELYNLPSSDFNEITSGSITDQYGNTYNAGAGYNEVAGLGSPVANDVVDALAVYGTSTSLVYTTAPPAAIHAGTAFSTVVQLENSSDADVGQAGVSVTLTLSSGTFSDGLSTMSTTTNAAGQATLDVTVEHSRNVYAGGFLVGLDRGDVDLVRGNGRNPTRFLDGATSVKFRWLGFHNGGSAREFKRWRHRSIGP